MAGLSFIFVIVFLSLIAMVIVTLGVRGSPIFTAPRCSKCSYDLRAMNFMSDDIGACPECGSNLSQPGSVTFGRLQRDRRKVVFGFALLILPWVLLIPLSMVYRRTSIGPARSAALSTTALLASLPRSNDAWDWQELRRRLDGGLLTTQEIDAAFQVLSGPTGPSAIPWADGFIQPAIQRKLASPQAITALLKANLGKTPIIQMRDRNRVDQALLVDVQPDRTSPAMSIRLGSMIWSLGSVQTTDGTKLALAPASLNPLRMTAADLFSGEGRSGAPVNLSIGHDLPVGEHELIFTFDIGVIDTSVPLRGMDGRPGTPDKWPPTRATWKDTVSHKVQIIAADEPVVSMLTDPKRDPMPGLTIRLDPLVVRPATRGAQMVVRWRVEGTNQIPLSYTASIDAGGTRISLGTLQISTGSNRTYSSGRNVTLQSVPTLPSTVDVALAPDPVGAERMPGVNEIWGVTHVIRGVPVERYDSPGP